MQPYVRTEKGVRYDQSWNTNPSRNPASTSSWVDKAKVELQVSNGIYFGDHKTPNNITFTRCVTSGGVISYGESRAEYGTKFRNGFAITGAYVDPACFLSSPYIPADFNRTLDRCMEKVYDQIKGDAPNLAVDFAERSQTVKMLKSALHMRRFVKDFLLSVHVWAQYDPRREAATKRLINGKYYGFPKRKSVRFPPKVDSLTRGQKYLDAVTGKWLEYRYGWLPLTSSIYDTVSAFRKEVKDTWHSVNARSGYKASRPDSSTGAGSYTSPRYQVIGHSISVRTQVGLYFSIPATFDVADFTSLSPAVIAWELVPFSFVADWFVGVGNYLEAWENHNRYKTAFQGGYVTHSYKELSTATSYGTTVVPYTYFPTGEYAGGSYKWTSTSCDRRLTYKNRYRLTSLPRPTQVQIKFRMGAQQFLDSAALLQQIVVKGLRRT